MKQLSILVILIILTFTNTKSQIVITKNDMPNIGDTIRYNVTYSTGGIDYTLTGNDYTWDFSGLGMILQEADTFISVSSTPLVYQIIFNLPPWNPPASIAQKLGDIDYIPEVTFTDNIDFFKEKNSSYSHVGYGITINNIPIPIKFDDPEIIYTFPLTIGNADSSVSSFSVSIPDLGYYETERKRVNIADGWGTLITPFGSFETIRVKSILTIHDSIYIDSLQAGFPVDREETEYKWLGQGFGRPLLRIVKSGILPPRVEYIAELQQPLTVDAGEDVTINEGESAQLEATVTGGTPPYAIVWLPGGLGNPVTVSPDETTTYTVTVLDFNLNYASDSLTVFVIPQSQQQNITIPVGWSGISSFIAPESLDLDSLLIPIQNELIILQSLEGVYYPENNLNTLGNWDSESGYMIKVTNETLLTISGTEVNDKTINFNPGWNIFPVLSSCDVNAEALFASISGQLIIVKEVAGWKLIWPEKGINNLEYLVSGKAYLLKVSAECSVTFPDCE